MAGGSGNRTEYSDFIEYNLNTGGMWVNTTQVDALVVPLTIELVDASGKSVKAGISESMPALIEKFKKETPKEFHAYIKNNQINQPNGLPGISQGGSPASCAAVNRHVSGADARNPDKYYLTPPCNYYSKFMHDHSLNGKAYGFASDDFNQQDTLLVSRKSVNMIIGIYWADALGATKPEVKPDAKPEEKPEAKPEVKPDGKPKGKPEDKPKERHTLSRVDDIDKRQMGVS